jgi:hypothetical protein
MKGRGFFSLDTIQNRLFAAYKRWTPHFRRSKAFDVLHYVVGFLYRLSNGQLRFSAVTISQAQIAEHINATRQWTNQLLQELVRDGWLESRCSWIGPMMKSKCTYHIGRRLRGVLVGLEKSRTNSDVNSARQVFPSPSEKMKNIPFRCEKNESGILSKLTGPFGELMRRWDNRGSVPG